MSTNDNKILPDKKGLVGFGNNSHRQTSITTYLHPHISEKSQKLEKQKTLQNSSTCSNSPIDLVLKSKKTKLTLSLF